MVRLYVSSEPYLLDEMDKRWRSKVQNSINLKRVLEKPDKDLCDFVETFPVFEEIRVLILKGTGILNTDCEELFSAVATTTEVIILEQEVDKRKKAYKWIQKNGLAEEIKLLTHNELANWIQSISENPIDASFLINYLGTDMYYLKNETERLNAYMEPQQLISAEWIQFLCKKNMEEKIFALADEISNRNLPKVMEYYETVMEQAPMKVLFMLKRHFQILLNAKALEGKSDKDVAAGCGVAPFTVKKYRQQANSYSLKEIKDKLELLAESEFALKTSTNDRLCLEQVMIQLTV